MFLFCWYFDFLCKFKIFNELCYIDKISFSLFFACFLSCVIKEWIVKLANASQFMQNMAVDSLIENVKTKIVIKFHLINVMTFLARVANSMVIFSASYSLWMKVKDFKQVSASLDASEHKRLLFPFSALLSFLCLFSTKTR